MLSYSAESCGHVYTSYFSTKQLEIKALSTSANLENSNEMVKKVKLLAYQNMFVLPAAFLSICLVLHFIYVFSFNLGMVL